MITKVTEQGLNIPKEFLEGMDNVQIRRENNQVIVTPLADQDPIWRLGEHPIAAAIKDASVNHDKYIYEQ